MFEKFIRNVLIKLINNDEKIKELLCNHVLTNENTEKKISETSQKITEEIVKQSLSWFEEKTSSEFNKKLVNAIDKCKSDVSINDVENLQEQIDSQIDIIQNIIKSNNIAQVKKLNELILKINDLEKRINILSKGDNLNQIASDVRREFTELNKQTRADVATLISKVKKDISDLDIELEAFVDTISEKLARIKK